MQEDWLAGFEMILTIGGIEYPFKTSSWNPKVNLVNRANSKYRKGFQVRKVGLFSGTMQADGPYRQGEIPLSVGVEYVVQLRGGASHVGFEVSLICEDIKFSTDVENGPSMAVTWQTAGEFNPIVS